jgi:hypothetical protein
MKTRMDAAWLPAVPAIGGMLGLALAGGKIVWGVAVSLAWAGCYGLWLAHNGRPKGGRPQDGRAEAGRSDDRQVAEDIRVTNDKQVAHDRRAANDGHGRIANDRQVINDRPAAHDGPVDDGRIADDGRGDGQGPEDGRTPDDEAQVRAFLHTVSLHRHDLINDIQLLQSYAQLGKIEKVRECIDMIRDKAAQETVLFHLGIPRLVYFLYRVSAEQRPFRLELELEPELHLDKAVPHAEAFADLVVDWIGMLQRHAGADEPSFLSLAMFRQDGKLHVILDYEGSYAERPVRERYEQSAAFIACMWPDATTAAEFSDGQLTVRLQIPLIAAQEVARA